MKAYIIKTDTQIEPFNDHTRDCLIMNKPLSVLQQEALDIRNLHIVSVSNTKLINDDDEYITFEDYLYFSPELLDEFISRSQTLLCPTAAALKVGISTQRTIDATQNVDRRDGYNIYHLTYTPKRDFRNKEIQAVIIDPDDVFEVIPMSKHMFGNNEYRVPLTDKILIQVEHWANLWAANIASLLYNLARIQKGPKFHLLWLAFKARNLNRWAILHKANRIGKNCDIHPTAYLEGSTIGDNVKIGAMAILRESIVGNNSYIANNAAVELSVIGEGSVLQSGTVVQYSVLYPGSFTFAKGLNASFLGRDTFIGDGATLADFRFDNNCITVMKYGQKIDTGNTFLGACLGHGVYIGSGSVVFPGRAIPNGYRLFRNELNVIDRIGLGEDISGYQLISEDVLQS